MLRIIAVLGGVLIFASCCVAEEAEGSLAEQLTALVKAHKGKAAVAVLHLKTGETVYINADEVMPTASLIKFPIMIEVYMQVLAGRIKLSDLVTLHEKDKVPGSGILTEHFSEGAAFPLRDAVRLMIAYSDNTATNLVLEKIGIPSTNKRMSEWGFPETRINSLVFRGSATSIDRERSKKYGLGSTTAKDMVRLLEKVYRHQVATPDYCQAMLEHLKKCQDKDMFPRLLPSGTVVAHKTGTVSNCKTDAGILYLKTGPVAVCVLTNDNEDRRWVRDNAGMLLCARVAKTVSDHYSGKK